MHFFVKLLRYESQAFLCKFIIRVDMNDSDRMLISKLQLQDQLTLISVLLGAKIRYRQDLNEIESRIILRILFSLHYVLNKSKRQYYNSPNIWLYQVNFGRSPKMHLISSPFIVYFYSNSFAKFYSPSLCSNSTYLLFFLAYSTSNIISSSTF